MKRKQFHTQTNSRYMIRKNFWLLVVPVALSFTACVNDDYDLSDVDTTVTLQATSLTVPINIDEITLEAILDLSDDSRIKNINGEYAVVEDGTFSSSAINVQSFTAWSGDITPATDDLTVNYNVDTDIPEETAVDMDPDSLLLSYDITDVSTVIDLTAEDVDENIIDLTHIGLEGSTLTLTLNFAGITDVFDTYRIENLQLQLLKGLEVQCNLGTYDTETGILDVGDNFMFSEGSLVLILEIDGISDYSGMNIDDERTFLLGDSCYVKTGRLTIYVEDIDDKYYDEVHEKLYIKRLIEDTPTSIEYSIAPVITDVVVEDFSGVVKYDIEDIDINPVEMNDLPDVLSQSGTDIMLENPQIYLQLNNPLGQYGINITTGLQITSRKGSVTADYILDNELNIDTEMNKYCLSPKIPDFYYSGTVDDEEVDFSDCEYSVFSTLGDVLSGDGLPEYLDIYVLDPQIPQQYVEDFKLGVDLDSVDGVYVFYAPLQLTEDAKIVYTDTINGWNDEDVDAITITQVEVNADISTDVPLELDVKVYPIDVNGNKIYDNGEVVYGYTETTVLYGMDEPIDIYVSGTVTHLDGIIVEARVTGTDETDEALQATQTITLKNIRATVSGTYSKEL